MVARLFVLALTGIFLAPVTSLASKQKGPQVVRDSRYIYHKVPLQDMTSQVRRVVFYSSSELFAKKIKELQEKNILPASLANAVLEGHAAGYKQLDGLIGTLESTKINELENDGIGLSDMVMSGVVISVAGKFSANLKIGGGGSVALGLVVLPYWVQRQPIVNVNGEGPTEYIELQTALIAWPVADVGFGVGGGIGLRFGAGMIWGPLDDPKDFVGPIVGVSKTFAPVGVGVHVKGGFLHNWKKGGFFQFPYVYAAWEVGATASAEAHVTLAYVIDGMKLVSVLGYDGLEQNPSILRVLPDGSPLPQN